MRSQHLLALQMATLVSAAASLPPPVRSVWEGGAEPKPKTPKRWKPTKAEKKAAKRARRTASALPGTPNEKQEKERG
jgi:hypothetical protein